MFTFESLNLIRQPTLGNQVPLELFRAIRLIGLYEGLPLHGKNTTAAVGRTIGASMPVRNEEDCFRLFRELGIGIPIVISRDEDEMRLAIEDCFCAGLPVQKGKLVCDLKGAIFEGSLHKVLNRRVSAREVKCNVNGDDRCEYVLHIHRYD